MFAAPLFAFRFEAQVWLPACGVLVAFCLISSAVYLLDPLAGEVLLYRLIQVGYSLQLKRMPLLDLFCLPSGFLLRAIAGALGACRTFPQEQSSLLPLLVGRFERCHQPRA